MNTRPSDPIGTAIPLLLVPPVAPRSARAAPETASVDSYIGNVRGVGTGCASDRAVCSPEPRVRLPAVIYAKARDGAGKKKGCIGH